MKQVLESQQIIFMLAEWLAGFLFAEGHMALPLENPSLFEFLDVPLVKNKDEVERLKSVLNKYRKDTEEWMNHGIGIY